MPRFIEIQDPEVYSASEHISVGDVLFFHASGARVRSGVDVIDMLGTFVAAVVGTEGQILTPQGPPNVVLFRALHPGKVSIDLVTGDPFDRRKTTSLRINIDG